MIKHFFDEILTPNGWRQNQLLDIAENGEILAARDGAAHEADIVHHGFAVPGMANVHSHAFQRAMAGLAEMAGPSADSFWSWRQVMYRFLSAITPDQLEAIASQLYLEMLKSGFTSVGEFHYLHHDRDGAAYADPSEMSGRIIAAAKETGIGLTLLPVLYRYGGFGGEPPQEHQRRFIMEGENFLNLVERLQEACKSEPSCIVGVAPHSLRAVDPTLLRDLIAQVPADMPCHIHIAEQQKEVADCVEWSGLRPVDWLFENVAVDERWCLVHATHIKESGRKSIAQSGAVVGLCPITEANLGDGVFPASVFLKDGGRIALGSDSNIYISLAEEVRMLEYGQRLTHESRNVLGNETNSTGMQIYSKAFLGGHQALGRPGEPGLQVGSRANFVVLDKNHPALIGKSARKILDSWLFAGDNTVVKDVAVDGKLVIRDRHHLEEEAITHRFRRVMKELAAGY
ncbi:formimidoylglutamate deiminase [Sneathiella litorea]|uniref:Formimidoylglutamate deiminase n=1 Tax=Sneathiella litorea TaxID=2606216 RepID=A0A6L8W9N6_9PROT|nr:formimidoylglutamate deiminase [Sneathiella litorea]MZR31868.1 formimidoylglutamate deiminase [Sneathiella litorea]